MIYGKKVHFFWQKIEVLDLYCLLLKAIIVQKWLLIAVINQLSETALEFLLCLQKTRFATPGLRALPILPSQPARGATNQKLS